MNREFTINLSLEELLWHCTVRVLVAGQPEGTGFFVAPRFIVTCAHVVRVDKNPPLTIVLSDGESLQVLVREVYADDYPDLALLELAHPKSCHDVYVELDADVQPLDKLRTNGFPPQYVYGDGLTLTCEGLSRMPEHPDAAFVKLSEGMVQEGYSGAPLLNVRTGAVCGLINSTRNYWNPYGGRAVSAAVILSLFQQHILASQLPMEITSMPWGPLRRLSCAAANGKGSTSATLSNFLSKWSDWSSQELAKLRADNLTPISAVRSPLDHYWRHFIQMDHWRRRLRKELESYVTICERLEIKDLPSIPPTVDGSYEPVAENLTLWLDTIPPWKSIKPSIRRPKQEPKHNSSIDWETLQEDFSRTLQRIKRVADPAKARLDIGFLIFGSQGSGKTEFLQTCATALHEGNSSIEMRERLSLFLPLLPWSDYNDVEEFILHRVRQAGGEYFWKNLEDLDLMLSSLQWNLVIVIDEFEKVLNEPNRYRNFRLFIKQSTKLNSLRYLLAVQETDLDSIAPYEDIWKLIAYQGDHSLDMGGWIDLTELNNNHGIGYKILRAADENYAADLLKERGLVLSPLIAQILLKLIGKLEIHDVVSLNFFGFVEAFWKYLKKSKDLTGEIEFKILEAMSGVAEAVVHSGSLTPSRELVNEFLKTKQRKHRDDISLLTDKSLIYWVYSFGSRLFDKSEVLLRLNWPFLWNLRLARQLWDEYHMDSLTEKSKSEVLKWIRNIRDSEFQLGIWEFVLLHADTKMVQGDLSYELSRDIWLLALDPSEMSWCAPCFAARWSSPEMQHTVKSELFKRTSGMFSERRPFFGLLFFATETPALHAPDRLRLLRPHYRTIGEMSLSAYFLYGVKRMLNEFKDQGRFLRCLHLLATSHLTGCAKELSLTAWGEFIQYRIAGQDNTVQRNLEFLISRHLRSATRDADEDYGCQTNNERPRQRYFREELLATALDWTWDQPNSDFQQIFELLNGMGWYDALRHGIDRRIATEMRREANLSFGRYFRKLLEGRKRRAGDQIEKYKTLIVKLLKGKAKNVRRPEELGFFLLRHAAFAGHGTALIPRELWEEFELVHRVPALERLLRHYPIQKRGAGARSKEDKSMRRQ